jgi:hypothetical protein
MAINWVQLSNEIAEELRAIPVPADQSVTLTMDEILERAGEEPEHHATEARGPQFSAAAKLGIPRDVPDWSLVSARTFAGFQSSGPHFGSINLRTEWETAENWCIGAPSFDRLAERHLVQ